MVDSIINCKNPLEAQVVLLAANYDKTSSFGKGANKGPVAIRTCLDRQIEFWERTTRTSPTERLKIAYHNMSDLNHLRPEEMVNAVESVFEKLYERGVFVLTVGGEHSVSNGPFRYLAKKHNPEDVTLFQIDAHLDMRDTDADYNDKPWGKYAHSCVMRRGAELGFRTVQVGIRASSKDEYSFAERFGSRVFRWGRDVPSIDDIAGSIQTRDVYVTIDVDGFDPAHMPETGTPVQGGIEWWYGQELLRRVFEEKKVIAADVVEVAPKQKPSLTAYGAAQLIYNMIAWKFAKK